MCILFSFLIRKGARVGARARCCCTEQKKKFFPLPEGTASPSPLAAIAVLVVDEKRIADDYRLRERDLQLLPNIGRCGKKCRNFDETILPRVFSIDRGRSGWTCLHPSSPPCSSRRPRSPRSLACCGRPRRRPHPRGAWILSRQTPPIALPAREAQRCRTERTAP